MKKSIIAVFGGRSTEHDISVITAIEALYAIPESLFDVYPVYLRDGKLYGGKKLYTLKNYAPFVPQNHVELKICGGTVYKVGRFGLKALCKPYCALLLTHGGEGENGALQGFLELNGIPYTSSDVFGSALCMNKYALKTRLSAVGVPVVPGKLVKRDFSDGDIFLLERDIRYPMFIKPNSQGSSIGIGSARNREELYSKLEVAFEYDDEVLVERCIADFIELNTACVSFDGKIVVSEPERPLSAGEILTFDDKYIVGSKSSGMGGGRREFPARVSDEVKKRITEITESVYSGLKLFGVVRIDYMLTGENLYLNEVNTIPGSLAHYLYPQKTYGEFLVDLIEEGAKRGVKKEPIFLTSVLTEGYTKSGCRRAEP